MVVFVNSTGEKITVSPELELAGKHLAVCREGSAKAVVTNKVPAVALAPRSSEVWIIGEPAKIRTEAENIAKVMHRISAFTSDIKESSSVVTPVLGNHKPARIQGNGKFKCLVEVIPLVKNTSYKFSCEIRKVPPVSAKKIEHRVVIYNRFNKKYKPLAKVGEDIPADGKWHKCEVTFKVPDLPGDFQIYLFNCSASGLVEMRYPLFASGIK